MLDIALNNVSYGKGRTALRDVSCLFQRGTHTAVTGTDAPTLLELVAGEIQADAGDVVFGTRRVNGLRRSRRPLLYATSVLESPLRWSVAHLLVAAVQQRGLDREDRQHEIEYVASKWQLEPFVEVRLRDLHASERLVAQLASIEILRPGVLVADRLFEAASASNRSRLVAQFHRTMRVIGATVVVAPSSHEEIAHCDEILVLGKGRVEQAGRVVEVYRHPASEESARATGNVSIVPLAIRNGIVESAIGSWSSDEFEGTGVALCRPEHFSVAKKGEESDLIVAIEEAWFDSGRWIVTSNVSGGVPLQFALPSGEEIRRGRLLALKYDPAQFTLLQRELELPEGGSVPTGVVPSRAESR